MAQRVALGRTLFQNPDIILMDEPFSALDYFTRRGLQETLLALFQKERKTIIFVTHVHKNRPKWRNPSFSKRQPIRAQG